MIAKVYARTPIALAEKSVSHLEELTSPAEETVHVATQGTNVIQMTARAGRPVTTMEIVHVVQQTAKTWRARVNLVMRVQNAGMIPVLAVTLSIATITETVFVQKEDPLRANVVLVMVEKIVT